MAESEGIRRFLELEEQFLESLGSEGEDESVSDAIKCLRDSLLSLARKDRGSLFTRSLLKSGIPCLNHVINTETSHGLDLALCDYLSLLSSDNENDRKILFNALFDLFANEEGHPTSKPRLLTYLNYLLTTEDGMDPLTVSVDFQNHLLSRVISLLVATPTNQSFLVSSLVLPYLLVSDTANEEVWQFVVGVWSHERNVESRSIDLCLTLLCCLVHVFVPGRALLAPNIRPAPVPVYDVRGHRTFWEILQFGLIDFDPLNRKRCQFLLDSVLESVSGYGVINGGEVFWWNYCDDEEKEMKGVWSDIMLMLETLEEKQVHIVNPVLKRLERLISATRTLTNGGVHKLHVSWLMVVFKRILSHDAKSIVRRGVREILAMELSDSPFLLRNNWKVILDPLLTAFGSSWVFARESHSNTASVCPPLVEELGLFLSRFISGLGEGEKSEFFSFFLSCFLSKNLPDIPMVYVTYSLSLLPSVQPSLIGPSSIGTVRSLVVSTSLVHRLTQRSAAQSFLLSAFSRHCSESFSFVDIFQTLGCFSRTECLVYGSQSWTEASQLIARIAKAHDDKGSLYLFLKATIGTLVKDLAQAQAQSEKSTWLNPLSVAQAVLLSADSNVTGTTTSLSASGNGKDSVISDLLSPPLETIASARTRVYMPVEAVISSVQLLSTLIQSIIKGHSIFNVNVKEGTGSLVYRALLPWLPEILSYFQDVLLNGLHLSSSSTTPPPPSPPPSSPLDVVQLFSDASHSLYQFISMSGWSIGDNDRSLSCPGLADRATDALLGIVKKNQVIELTAPLLGSVSVLEWVCENGNETRSLLTSDQHQLLVRKLYSLPVNITINRPAGTHGTIKEYGRSIGSCLSSYWSVLHHVLLFKSRDIHVTSYSLSVSDHVTIGSHDVVSIATSCIEHFDALGSDLALPLSCLATLVPQVVAEMGVAYLFPVIERVWPLVLELKEHLFPLLKSLEAFVQLMYHQMLIESPDTDLIQLQIKYANEIFAISEVKTGVCNVLAEHLCTVIKGLRDRDCANKTDHTDSDTDSTDTDVNARLTERAQIITHMCGFGPIFKKNLRVMLDVDQFVVSLGESCSSNSLQLREVEGDLMVRVRALNMLLELSSSSNVTPTIVTAVIESIVNELKELNSLKPRYYINSYSHRYRLRLAQTLLVLYKAINKSMVDEVVMAILDCLEIDNQLSVRYTMEWLVVMLISQFPFSWKELLLPHLQMNTGRRLSRFCSIFTITVQLGKCLSSTDEMVDYYSQVIPLVFQWSLCHHFVVRLYAAGSVVQLYRQSSSLLADIPSLSFIHQFIPFIEQYSDTAKSKKLESNVFFSLVHPCNDFNLQVIFHILPSLTGVIEEEWIPFTSFTSSSNIWSSSALPPLPITCTNTAIINASAVFVGPPSSADNHEGGDEAISGVSMQPTNGTVSIGDDIQRKITPWNSSTVALSSELFPSSVSPSLLLPVQNEKKRESQLILVASLINKQPNLGGLCRTCEIFGVAELVMGSTAVLEEKEFKSLSVTAEKWLKISQVKPSELYCYLLEMRKKGYTLVGIEQTAQSKLIAKYQFPIKTLLLLGNEREGIPVELIHLLDECVEIPQFGVIRSLNVHVSGAIVVWEYTKQHLQL